MKKRLGDDCFLLLEALMGEDDVVLFLFRSGPQEVEGCFVLSHRHPPKPTPCYRLLTLPFLQLQNNYVTADLDFCARLINQHFMMRSAET